MNCLRYCPKFLNKPSPHPRIPIYFTAPRGTICLLELWDQSNDALYCDHFCTVTTLLHGRPRSVPVSSKKFYSSQRSDLLIIPTVPCVPGALLWRRRWGLKLTTLVLTLQCGKLYFRPPYVLTAWWLITLGQLSSVTAPRLSAVLYL
jgi:hypothetical protein